MKLTNIKALPRIAVVLAVMGLAWGGWLGLKSEKELFNSVQEVDETDEGQVSSTFQSKILPFNPDLAMTFDVPQEEAGFFEMSSSSGYQLWFGDSISPFNGQTEKSMATRLLAPDGTEIQGEFTGSLYGAAHWFRWQSHPSWRYDALRQWTGGAHCCMWYWFVSKTPPYHMLPRFDAGVNDIELLEPDSDGAVGFSILEDNYSFGTDTANRTLPTLLWRMSDEGPVLARDLMKQWKMDVSQLAAVRARANEIAPAPGYYSGAWINLLTSTVITQYYSSGDVEYARWVFDVLWSGDEAEAESFWAEILRQMRYSRYGVPDSGLEISNDLIVFQ